MGHVYSRCLHEDGKVFRRNGFRDVRRSSAADAAPGAEVLPAASGAVWHGVHVGRQTGPLLGGESASRRARQQVQPRSRQPETFLRLLDNARSGSVCAHAHALVYLNVCRVHLYGTCTCTTHR